MTTNTIIPLTCIAILVIWFIAVYNKLTGLKNRIPESWADVDSELKRRYDLIPNLVKTVKRYTSHEQDVLIRVSELRQIAANNNHDIKSQANDENNLISAIKELYAAIENYPDLKASEQFQTLQDELINTEDRIQAARRFYNANIRDNNTAVQSIPSNIVASIFNFKEADYFEIDTAVRNVPSVST